MNLAKSLPFRDQVDVIMTHANAHEWDSATDKYVFVEGLLNELDIRANDARVAYVEQRFEAILDGSEITEADEESRRFRTTHGGEGW